jgi:SNF2 family DNA or RNA helicase
MGNLLARHLAGRCATAFLHGGLAVRRRDDMVRRFQSGEVPVFLVSLRAGGFGLNLSRATHVVHFDRWWNPAVEDQATDRAHRIGQDRSVQVHRLITEGTVEDRIAALLARKRDLADRVVGAGEAWLSELSDEELSQLVQLQRAS